MSIPNNNLAGRLYNLMVNMKEAQSGDPYKALGEVFGVDSTDKATILQNYAEMFNMATEEKRRIKGININNHDKYLKALDNVIEGLSKINLNDGISGMGKFRSYFDDRVLIPLEYCAEFLSNYSSKNVINEEEIKDLLEEVNKLIEQVLNMEIDKDVKHICMYNLNNIRDAIIRYNLFGSEGLMKNIESSLGSLILNQNKVKNETGKNLFKNIFNIISKINLILTLGNSSANLIEEFAENIKKIS